MPNNSIPITIEYIASNSNNSDWLISTGINSSTNLYTYVYGYLYCKMNNLILFNKDSTNTVTRGL